MNELIYEFFYDAIGRVVPGLVILGFYWRNNLLILADQFKDYSIAVVGAILVAAWVIGIVPDLLWAAIGLGKRAFGKSPAAPRPTPNSGPNGRPNDLPFYVFWQCDHLMEDDKKHIRRIHFKQSADRVFLRAVACIFLFSCFIPPADFERAKWVWPWGLAGSLVFGALWLFAFLSNPERKKAGEPGDSVQANRADGRSDGTISADAPSQGTLPTRPENVQADGRGGRS